MAGKGDAFTIEPLKRSPGQKSYFYLDGKLYKTVYQDRSGNILHAFDFQDNAVKAMVLSDAKRKMKPAFDTSEVSRMINRHPVTIFRRMKGTDMVRPVMIATKKRNFQGDIWGVYKWSPENVLELHDLFMKQLSRVSVQDGVKHTPRRFPSRKELIAIMRNQPMFYMKTSDGEMVPVWSAYNEV